MSGFQTYFAVWDIQDCVSFAKDQTVRKEMGVRGQPIAAAKFLMGSYFVASVDVKGTVRIWNYKQNTLVQTLQPELQNTKVQGLIVLSQTRFVVLSRTLVFYNTPVVPDV